MSYSVSILRRAQKELTQLSPNIYENVCENINKLTINPRPVGCKKLTGRDGWRIRIGNYRVVYEIDDKRRAVLILNIGHRRNIYKP